MNRPKFHNLILSRFYKCIYIILDSIYSFLDKKYVRRTRNILRIPNQKYRKGGKYSYAEWSHVIGIFQTLIFQNLNKFKNSNILDIGCGTGLIGIACEPFIKNDNTFIGIDVMEKDIKICKKIFPLKHYKFIHLDTFNPEYSPQNSKILQPWPLESGSISLATALSVWTHLNQDDSTYYFKELDRVLEVGGRAIITFFLLDSSYYKKLTMQLSDTSKYHNTNPNLWIFNQNAYNSNEWFSPKWAKLPEYAIGVTENGLKDILNGTTLKLISTFPGTWKEKPGLYFQDVCIFEKLQN